MSILNICPCCSNSLLHHFGNHREYWFCRHCWSEMPNLESAKELKQKQMSNVFNLSTGLVNRNKLTLVS